MTDKKKKKAYTVSMSAEEREKIQKKANKYFDGNMSQLIINAALEYKGANAK